MGGKVVGKAVGARLYLHVSALRDAMPEDAARVRAAAALSGATDFNVVRIERLGDGVALLEYPGFFEEACPSLRRSWRVEPSTNRVSFRDYSDSLNPPVLHRKELLLPDGHPEAGRYAALTAALESLGLFDDPVRIGFRSQWSRLLREAGYRIVGHDLVPIGNDEEGDGDWGPDGAQVRRHLTALSRHGLSAPMSAMLRTGLLDGGATLFDYGCGKGDDVASLRAMGVAASGWDPHYAPDNLVARADIVNIGFVINVIEDPAERREVLIRAFGLADVAVCVSAMLTHGDAIQGKPYADGILTRWGTFQKYYSQAELRAYVERTLGVPSVALAPGVFLAFSDTGAEQRFHLGRSRSRLRLRPPAEPRPLRVRSVREPKPPKEPKAPREPKLPKPPPPQPWELCPDGFATLKAVWEEHGREPGLEELGPLPDVEAAFRSMARAFRAAWDRLDRARLEAARAQRAEDTLVYLALQRFRRRKQYKELDLSLRRDVRAFFGDYVSALSEAERLLASAAAPEALAEAAARAAEQGLGWLAEGRSLQVDASLIERLPAVLRVYVGCAAVLYGDVEMADLVKIHLGSGKVTMIRCDDFSLPLPEVVERVKVNLRTQDVRVFSYGPETSFEPPILYLKSRFMNEETSGYAEQAAFDAKVGTLVKVDEASRGPSGEEWAALLAKAGLVVVGHDLVEDDRPPSLDDPCGANLTYRDLIACGETALTTGLPNLPKNPESWKALRALTENVLDPVIDWFGAIELTYGFCSPELAKLIPGRIAPELDQHAAHETKPNGCPVCPRLGAAVDFLVRDEDMLEVARWVAANIPFDRLYFYGRNRPIHISYGPEAKREAYEMVQVPVGRRMMPKKLRLL
ncbi:DNA phosphorothioation-associated putative methyltransferase [Azospirillum sp. YIM DDC1]|uniref:DNA phosphorothioation-associated putative methyltransferase n=1 Tax=Azospirillum aestuarii TaxID=2802052 RepID=A0ABS1HRS9_9PROT|nr:DNA phosphorothioation-associated putative methyltransferase [Azospirillum aestuarii]MBK4717535.1 DNA phosphorothioation-associated putative methyltransferase [Azospirillum aestuarii]